MKRLKRMFKIRPKERKVSSQYKITFEEEKNPEKIDAQEAQESSIPNEESKESKVETDDSFEDSLENTKHKESLSIGTMGKDLPTIPNELAKTEPKKLDYKMSFYFSLLPHLDEFNRNEWLYFQTKVVRVINKIKYKMLPAPYRCGLITNSAQRVKKQSPSTSTETSLIRNTLKPAIPSDSSQITQTMQNLPSLTTLVAPSQRSSTVSCYKLSSKHDIKTISVVSIEKTMPPSPPSSPRRHLSLPLLVASSSSQPLLAQFYNMNKTRSAEHFDQSDDEKERIRISSTSSIFNQQPPLISSVSTLSSMPANQPFSSMIKSPSPPTTTTLVVSSSLPSHIDNLGHKKENVDHLSQSDGEIEIRRLTYRTSTTLESHSFTAVITQHKTNTQPATSSSLRLQSFLPLLSLSTSELSCYPRPSKTKKFKSTENFAQSDGRKEKERSSTIQEINEKSESFLDSLSHDEISAEGIYSSKPSTSNQLPEPDKGESEESSSSGENVWNTSESESTDPAIMTSVPESMASTVKPLKTDPKDLEAMGIQDSNDIQFAVYVTSALNKITDRKTKLLTKHNILNILMQAEYNDLDK